MASLSPLGIAVGDGGPAWTLNRKLFVTALRQFLSDTPHVEKSITEQATRALRYIDDQQGQPFYPEDILPKCLAEVISKIVFGSRFNSSDPDFSQFLELVKVNLGDVGLNEMAGFCDFFPFTKYVPLEAYKRKKELDHSSFAIIRKQLKKAEEDFDPSVPSTNFISSLLKEKHEVIAQGVEAERVMSKDCLLNIINDMFVAGFETVSTILWWVIAYMANYPDVQTKAQRELDDIVGRDRFPSLDDHPNMPFFQATIMEVQRLANIGDCTIHHYTLKDTFLCGHRVPKGTVVLVNLPAIHLDPEFWENPAHFNPYRHIDTERKLITQQRNWMPFSAGCRYCPGESFAKVELFFFSSIMLQHFTFHSERGKEPPSLKGFVSVMITRPHSFAVCAVRR